MLFSEATFIGVDPSGGRKPFTYAALDDDGKLLALNEGELDELLAFVGGQRSAFVAVNAPSQTNKGLVKQEQARGLLASLHTPGRGAEMRMVEHQLRERGITVAATPARVETAPVWMQMGFSLYRKLESMGYKPYPAGADATHQWLETHPHAAFCALLGLIPLQKNSLEGRLQRQLILHEQKLGIHDPMDFFEELTRFKLLRGTLPLDRVYAPNELDALVAALTALRAAAHPDQITLLGAPEEGQLALPVAELKQRY